MDRLEEGNHRVTLKVTESLLKVASLVGSQSGEKQLRVIQEWMCQGAEEAIMRLLEAGDISVGLAAEALDIPIDAVLQITWARGIDTSPIEEDLRGIRKVEGLPIFLKRNS